MENKKTFISHSSMDKNLVTKIAEVLEKQNVWFDMWDMDAGDVLSEKIEAGIDEAKNFLIILSKHSLESSWIKYELNMALIKYLENEDYRLIVAKIDNVEVPLRLKPFLRVDSGNVERIVESIVKPDSSSPRSKTFKRQFVNRNDEITALQDKLYDPEIRFINVIGFFGIGKLSLAKESLKRTYSNPKILEISLSGAHFGSRLTLELCSMAGIGLPADGAEQQELDELNLLAVETLISNESFLVFNRTETILDDDGSPNEDFIKIIDHLKSIKTLIKNPIIFLSTRWLNLTFIKEDFIENLRVRELSAKHLTQIITSEIERTDPTYKTDVSKLSNISELLHGYPLSGRLAAPIIVKYGIEYLSNNLQHLNKLKIDVAEEIIAKAKLQSDETRILEILSIFDRPLNASYLNEILNLSQQDFNKHIDNLVSFNLLETDGKGLLLHPLINDFYIRVARASQEFTITADKLSTIAKRELKKYKPTDQEFVYWLTNACRLLFYSGKPEESRELRSDLIGELKDAAIKLYQRQDYSTSLNFCDEFLDSRPFDKDVLFTKSRCLSRLGKESESIEILNKLKDDENKEYKLAKYEYAIGRAYIENSHKDIGYLDDAEKHFMESIRINEHETSLQSMGELLFRKNKNEEAASFIERKLKSSPSDPYALSIYSDILWSMDEKKQALEKILDALKFQPTNPNFLFRAGRFLSESGVTDKAYGFFKQAVELDDTYLDAQLSLIDTCIDLNYIGEAKTLINTVAPKVKGEKKNVFDSIKANYLIKEGNLDEAESIAKKLLQTKRNVITLGLNAKICIHKIKESTRKGLTKMAELDKNKAVELINEGLKIEPDNVSLKNMLDGIEK